MPRRASLAARSRIVVRYAWSSSSGVREQPPVAGGQPPDLTRGVARDCPEWSGTAPRGGRVGDNPPNERAQCYRSSAGTAAQGATGRRRLVVVPVAARWVVRTHRRHLEQCAIVYRPVSQCDCAPSPCRRSVGAAWLLRRSAVLLRKHAERAAASGASDVRRDTDEREEGAHAFPSAQAVGLVCREGHERERPGEGARRAGDRRARRDGCRLITPNAGAEHADDLRIVQARTLAGPNIWDLAPVVLAELRAGSLAAHAPCDVPGFGERLLGALPGLSATHGGRDAASRGAALPRSWGEALVRVALALQRLTDSPANFGRVVIDAPEEDRWTVVLGFDEEVLATEALYAGARVLRDCLRGDDPEVEDIVAELADRYRRARPGATSLVMLEAARRRGIPVRRNTDDGIVQIGLGAAQRWIRSTMTDFTSVLATSITSDKHWTKQVLKRA